MKTKLILMQILLFCAVSVSAQTPLSMNGRLHVSGKSLMNECGTAVQLRGLSTHGIMFYQECYTENSIKSIAQDWKADMIRLAVYTNNSNGATRGYAQATDQAFYQQWIDQMVTITEKYGIYVIIDWHILSDGNPATYQPLAKSFFTLMAQKYKNKKHVIYEICNEPNSGTTWDQIKTYAADIIPAIRAQDPNAVILVGTPEWSSRIDQARQSPLASNLNSNVMYSLHFYAGTPAHDTYKTYLTDAMSANFPVFVSEWGMTDASGAGNINASNTTNWLALLATNKVSWANWQFSDKAETSSLLKPGSCISELWTNFRTDGGGSGQIIYDELRKAKPYTACASVTLPAIVTPAICPGAVGNLNIYGCPITNSFTTNYCQGYNNKQAYVRTDFSLDSVPYFTFWKKPSEGSTVYSSVVSNGKLVITSVNADPNYSTMGFNFGNLNATTLLPIDLRANAKLTFDVSFTKTSYAPTDVAFFIEMIDANENSINASALGAYNRFFIPVDGSTKSIVADFTNGLKRTPATGGTASNPQEDTFLRGQFDFSKVTKITIWVNPGVTGIYARVPFTGTWTIDNFSLGYDASVAQACDTYVPQVPPVVSLTAPANNSTACVGTPVTLTANASDANGTVSKVDFFDGATLLSTVATAPYTYTWSNAAAGTHSITAKATDNQNAATTSSAISITVNAAPAAPVVTAAVSYCQNATATALTATGTALKWYTVATAGTSSATAPVPSTATVGTSNNYVSQTVNGCEGPRAMITVTVNAAPSAPPVTTPVTYCQNATATALTATGTALKWYTAASGGTGSATAPVISTATLGTINSYVSQTISGCESPRAMIAVTVNAAPSAPTVISPVTYCQNATATALTATGISLQWYIVQSGGSGSATAPVPSTANTGTSNNYVSQTVSGCESPRAIIAVTVNAAPSAPTVTSPVTYCQNATVTALTATGTALQWYTVASGGTGSATAPIPSTTTIGTTNNYVSQTVNGCEGSRALIAVTVNAAPVAPTVTSTVTYCQNATATVLTATGTALKWYTVQSGGTSSANAPLPSTSIAGTTNYYVSQTASGCESVRAMISVIINAAPLAPTVISPVNYCQNAAATALTATGTSLQWYTVSTGGTGSATAPIPSTAATGTTNYYVSQTVNGCEGTRALIAVIVGVATSAPTVTTPVIYCQNATATALTATGTSLQWYTVQSGGSGSATAPVPSTANTGTSNNYVSQIVNGCEGPRALIAVTVNAAPSAPTVTSPVTYCQNAAATALTATGVALQWYSVQMGGSGSATAPVPSTTTSGTTNNYVSQTVSGCESPRAMIAVTINAIPSAPTVTSPVTYCQNASATALTATGTALKWYTVATNGTSSANAPLPSTATVGTINNYVSQTVNGCESPRAMIAVTVNTAPSAPTVISPVTYCQNAAATALTATGTSLQWYTVQSGGSGSASAPVPSTATTGTSNNYVSQTFNGCEGSRALIAVTITATTSTANAGPDQNIVSSSTNLAANTPTSGTGMWTVINGSGTFSNAANPASGVTGMSNGINTFEWTISNSICASSSDQVIIKVGASPVPQIISGPDSVGYGTNGVTYSVGNFPGSSYNWTVPAGVTIVSGNGTNSITVNFGNSGGTGLVSVIETNTFGSATSTKNITAGAAPSISSVSGPATVQSGETHTYTVPADPNPNTVYTWTVPPGATIVSGQGSNSVTIRFIEGSSGNIGVTASNGFGTGTNVLPVTVNSATGLWAHSNVVGSASVFPNPFSEEINLIVNAPVTEKMQLKIIDMRGEVVFESDAYSTNEKISLGRNLSEGIYIIQAISNGNSLLSKVEKLR